MKNLEEGFIKAHWQSMGCQALSLGVIWCQFPGWKILKANHKACSMFEYLEEELQALQVQALSTVDQVDLRLVFDRLVTTTNPGNNYLVSENITKKGRIITCQWNNTLLKTYDNEIFGICSLIEDISNKVTRKAELDAILYAFPGIVFRIVRKENDFFIASVNDEIFPELGLRPEELNNKSLAEAFGEKCDLNDFAEQVFKSKTFVTNEILVKSKTNKIFQAKGCRYNGTKAILCLFDITSQKQKDSAIASAIDQQSPDSAIGTIKSIIELNNFSSSLNSLQTLDRLNNSNDTFVREIASLSSQNLILNNRLKVLQGEVLRNKERLNSLSSLEDINLYIRKLPGGWWCVVLLFSLATPMAIFNLFKLLFAVL